MRKYVALRYSSLLQPALFADPMRIALIHDWLDTWGGGENVLAALLALYPEADLFALVDFLSGIALRARRRLAPVPAAATVAEAVPLDRPTNQHPVDIVRTPPEITSLGPQPNDAADPPTETPPR